MLQDNLSPLAIDLTIPLERQIQEAVLGRVAAGWVKSPGALSPSKTKQQMGFKILDRVLLDRVLLPSNAHLVSWSPRSHS